jgi:hypothetical protein
MEKQYACHFISLPVPLDLTEEQIVTTGRQIINKFDISPFKKAVFIYCLFLLYLTPLSITEII